MRLAPDGRAPPPNQAKSLAEPAPIPHLPSDPALQLCLAHALVAAPVQVSNCSVDIGAVEVQVQVNLTATGQAYTTRYDRTLDVPAGRGVLSGAAANPTSAAPALVATLVNGPAHGTLTLAPDGGFTYTPAAGYAGTDAFDFAATDGCATAVATAAITVGARRAARVLHLGCPGCHAPPPLGCAFAAA
jgi:hypothetical protein